MNLSRKKTRPIVRLPRKSEISGLRSTSPDSPTHIGAASVKPPVVEARDQYHPTVEKLQHKKTRHRRSGSGTITPRSSPKQEERKTRRWIWLVRPSTPWER